MTAAEAILRRVWPAPRGRRLAVRLPAVDTVEGAREAAVRLVAEAAAGTITADDAAGLLALVEGAARLGTVADLEDRIAALETQARDRP